MASTNQRFNELVWLILDEAEVYGKDRQKMEQNIIDFVMEIRTTAYKSGFARGRDTKLGLPDEITRHKAYIKDKRPNA